MINALSFFLAAALEFFIDYEYNIKDELKKVSSNLLFDCAESSEMKSLIENIKLAFNYIISHKYLKGLLLIFASRPEQQFILVYYLILIYLSGVVVSWVDIPANTIIQKTVPDEQYL